MRKIILVLAVLALAAPVLADVEVKVVHATKCLRDVEIQYQCNDPNRIRAFGLDIDVNDANIVSLGSYDPSYYIYLSSIVINGTAGDVNDYGAPNAVGGIGSKSMTIEFGSLYDSNDSYGDNSAPGPNGVLLKFSVDGDCCITLTENTTIGGVDSNGVVMEDTDKSFGASYVTLTDACVERCDADFSNNGYVEATDVGHIVSHINQYGGFFWSVPHTHPNWAPKYDFNGDNWCNSTDVGLLVAYINTYGGIFFSVQCPGPGFITGY